MKSSACKRDCRRLDPIAGPAVRGRVNSAAMRYPACIAASVLPAGRGSSAVSRIGAARGDFPERRCAGHRWRPQRPGLRGLPGRGRVEGAGAGAPPYRRRCRGHRGIPSGLPQLAGQLHGQPAQPEGDRRPAPGRARPARGGKVLCELPAFARWPQLQARRRAHPGRGGEVVGARCPALAGLLRDARSHRGGAARVDAAHAAKCFRPLRAGRLAQFGIGGEAVEDAGHARPPRPARPVHQVGR